MRRSFIILVLLVFTVKLLVAQAYLPNVYPPTPQASSLAKNIENSVSYYSGTYLVDIPLFEYSVSPDLGVSVGLKYNTKGVQLAEISGNVGLGWSLSYGGSLTRQVRDKPDELYTGFSNIYKNLDQFTTDSRVRSSIYNYASCALGCGDIEPDIYYFNAGKYSGKFIIDPVTKDAVVQSPSDIKIEITFADSRYTPQKFIVTTPDGLKYYFGANDNDDISYYDINMYTGSGQVQPISTVETPNDDLTNYRSSWLLTQMKDKNNRSIYFNYNVEVTTVYNSSYGISFSRDGNSYTTSLTKTISKQNVLHAIMDSPIENEAKSKILVEYANQRKDLDGSFELKNIKSVYNNSLIKSVEFITSYSTGSDSDILPIILSKDPQANKRYYLDGISFKGSDQKEYEQYAFEYFNKNLPNRHSKAADYWGYYNGIETNNKSDNIFRSDVSFQVELDGLKTGVLKKIIHPTKGETIFEYDTHKVFTHKFFENLYILNETEDENLYEEHTDLFTLDYDSKIVSSASFNFRFENTVDGKLRYVKICQDLDDVCNSFYANIYDTQGNLVKALDNTINLDDGDYVLKIGLLPSAPIEDTEFTKLFGLKLIQRRKVYPSSEKKLFIGGGLRIKKILFNDSNSKPLLTKEYDYTMSSGRLHAIPTSYYFYDKINIGNSSLYLLGVNYRSNTSPLSQYSGNGEVGYSEIKETRTDSLNATFYRKFTFTNYYDGGSFYVSPMHMKDDLSWARGLLLTSEDYDSSGKLLRKEENTYRFFKNDDIPFISYKDYRGTVISNLNYILPDVIETGDDNKYVNHYERKKNYNIVPIYLFGKYRESFNEPFSNSIDEYRIAFFYGSSVDKVNTVISEYFDNGKKITSTNYRYESPNHLQLTHQDMINSQKDTVSTEYIYSPDYNSSGNTIIDKLVQSNRISEPLEVRTFKNKQQISIEKIEYDEFGNNILPKSIFKKYGSGNVGDSDLKMTFNKYDLLGNIIQYTPANNMVSVVIWGYNGQYPIAEIKNATYAEVETVVKSIFGVSSIDDLSKLAVPNETKLKGGDLQEALPKSLVTTYTYQPLVGMTSMTDSRGVTTIYEYDPFGRLKGVKDANGKLINTYDYHYQNQ